MRILNSVEIKEIKELKYVTATEIKELLENQSIYSSIGTITMNLNNTSVVIKQNDIIGNALQEWLGQVLKDNDIYFKPAKGQTFPDFYLGEDSTKNLCEMKTFYKAPNFDVANFYAYIDSLTDKAYRLDSDYLIFKYHSDENGCIKIQNIWCKKVWEITGKANDFDLKCQRKKGQIVNIRPVTFYSEKSKLKPFANKEELLAALYKTHLSTTNQTRVSKDWLNKVIENYKSYSGIDLKDRVYALI